LENALVMVVDKNVYCKEVDLNVKYLMLFGGQGYVSPRLKDVPSIYCWCSIVNIFQQLTEPGLGANNALLLKYYFQIDYSGKGCP
jgi:hypothetical protein